MAQVEVEMVLLQSGQADILWMHQVNLEQIRMQPPKTEANGNIHVKLATPTRCIRPCVVLDFELFWPCAVLLPRKNRVMGLVGNKADTNLSRHDQFEFKLVHRFAVRDG